MVEAITKTSAFQPQGLRFEPQLLQIQTEYQNSIGCCSYIPCQYTREDYRTVTIYKDAEKDVWNQQKPH